MWLVKTKKDDYLQAGGNANTRKKTRRLKKSAWIAISGVRVTAGA